MNSAISHPDSTRERSLSELDTHIRTQVGKKVHHKAWLFLPGAIDMEADDIAQDIWICFWKKSLEQLIEEPKYYINSMVRHKMADLTRRHKPIYPIPLDDDGELYQGDMIITISPDMGDPSYKIEQEESEQGNIRAIVGFILTLPCRQQHAMLCMLKPLARDFWELEIALQELGIDISQYEWPQDPSKIQKLRASLFVAKKKLALYLKSVDQI